MFGSYSAGECDVHTVRLKEPSAAGLGGTLIRRWEDSNGVTIILLNLEHVVTAFVWVFFHEVLNLRVRLQT